jgi:hypothetical protein
MGNTAPGQSARETSPLPPAPPVNQPQPPCPSPRDDPSTARVEEPPQPAEVPPEPDPEPQPRVLRKWAVGPVLTLLSYRGGGGVTCIVALLKTDVAAVFDASTGTRLITIPGVVSLAVYHVCAGER